MSTCPVPEVREIIVLKADRLCASILQQIALAAFPQVAVRIENTLASTIVAMHLRPVDLLITGVTLFDGDVLELLGEAAVDSRNFRRVLVVTGRREHRILSLLRGLPIDGVFDPTTDELAQLESAIRMVSEGKQYWSASVLERLARKDVSSGSLCHILSPTEQLVFAVIGDGSDDESAADRLNLRPSTIHSVRRELHRKLKVQHKGELVRLAVQHGYVRFTPDGVDRPGFNGLLAACGKSSDSRFR